MKPYAPDDFKKLDVISKLIVIINGYIARMSMIGYAEDAFHTIGKYPENKWRYINFDYWIVRTDSSIEDRVDIEEYANKIIKIYTDAGWLVEYGKYEEYRPCMIGGPNHYVFQGLRFMRKEDFGNDIKEGDLIREKRVKYRAYDTDGSEFICPVVIGGSILVPNPVIQVLHQSRTDLIEFEKVK